MANPIVVVSLLAASAGIFYWVSKKTAAKKKKKKKKTPTAADPAEPTEPAPTEVPSTLPIPFQSGEDFDIAVNPGDVVHVTYDADAEVQPYVQTSPSHIPFKKEEPGVYSFTVTGLGPISPVVLQARANALGPPVGDPMRLFMEVTE